MSNQPTGAQFLEWSLVLAQQAVKARADARRLDREPRPYTNPGPLLDLAATYQQVAEYLHSQYLDSHPKLRRDT